MPTTAQLKKLINRANSKVFRRAYVKRRQLSDGLFESTWTEITQDVKKWGKIKKAVDDVRINKFRLGSASLKMRNDEGFYNDENDPNSIWFGFANRQRSLIKIEAGFEDESLTSSGIWRSREVPGFSIWNDDLWDVGTWEKNAIVYRGILSGDMNLSSRNDMTFKVLPVAQVFREFPAAALTGWTSTGVTASRFCEIIRDQTDGAGGNIFLPFFDDTTSNFIISTTTSNYAQLNTSASKEVIDKSVWDVLEKIAEAENFVVSINRDGQFTFTNRDASSEIEYEFFGLGDRNSEFGLNMMGDIKKFGPKISKFYSRVQCKFGEESTSTSYAATATALIVSGTNASWNLGYRSYEFENTLLDSVGSAGTLVNTMFNDLSSLKREIDFSTSFIPHLDLLNKVKVSYDGSGQITPESLWDDNDWADTAGALPTGSELIWDGGKGDSFKLQGEEMKILSISLDLDNFKTDFVLRET